MAGHHETPSDPESSLYFDSNVPYHVHQTQRPLIDLIPTDSKNLGDHQYTDDSDDDQFFYAEKASPWKDWQSPRMARWPQRLVVPRRVQRHLIIYLIILVTVWATWKWYLRPAWQERQAMEKALRPKAVNKGMFGSNLRPGFTDMIMVKKMDSDLLPGAGERRRLVFVGDVHGCKDELVALLAKVGFQQSRDHLILTGDIVAKGPDSAGVVSLARDLGASCVRGNHDDRVLLSAAQAASHSQPSIEQEKSAVAAALGKHNLRWLRECPVILNVGHVPGMGEILVAHAGLVPGVPLERQDPFETMNMRSIDLETRVPSEEHPVKEKGTIGWEMLWNYCQKSQPSKKRQTVVYGHNSKRGLNIQKYSKGLDTGCVKGGKLTALVVDSGGSQSYVSVACEKREGYK
ncbi:hypothetical protein H2201_002790 [Coniosporium apollinis]|uniref:Calcineurin-like phosphoesterase domain-containing protein n=1 Tax=Coniosporium apollinis TaxID=61459 RepID=A0ABQ9NXX5_9PEZI|nr:hypothetical protein H2201_002790 [Coniosporium apollinis]